MAVLGVVGVVVPALYIDTMRLEDVSLAGRLPGSRSLRLVFAEVSTVLNQNLVVTLVT